MDVEVHTVNAFTNNQTGGNPAGVVLDAKNLTSAQMQCVAKKVGLSETAFVTRSEQADFEVRFFTPTAEVDFCGHATLAVFSLMKVQGVIPAGNYTQLTKAGILGIKISDDNAVVMEQVLPQFLEQFTADDIAGMLNISPNVISDTGLPIKVVSTGLADLIVPIATGYLDSIIPNKALISQFSKTHNVVGFHLFELPCTPSEYSASCRNFAPFFGIDEESATGSSCGALACYLATFLDTAPNDFLFEQGRAMGCSSHLRASISKVNSDITKVKVGGTASVLGTLTVIV